MGDDTSGRRPTRRNRATQPIERGHIGAPTAGQSVRFTPLHPEDLADILTIARAQRAREDTAAELRKAS